MQKKQFLFFIIFFIIMAVYALLRELRDALFINLVGLQCIPKVKLLSLCFILIELLCYQKLIQCIKPKKTFLLFTIFYSIFLGLVSLIFFYKCYKMYSIIGYIFYIILEGYAPFIWNLVWAIFTDTPDIEKNKNQYMIASLCAQIGGFIASFLFYFLIKNNILHAIHIIFGSIMLISSILLTCSACIMYALEFKIHSDELYNNKNILLISHKNDTPISFFNIWYTSFKNIISSFYIMGIFLIIFCWEMINIILNYFRLGVFLEKSSYKSAHLLRDLYYNISLTYFLGICIVLIGTSFFVRIYGIKKVLLFTPILLYIGILPCLYFNNKHALIMFYNIIKACYPAFIFPIKESLYIITSKEVRFQSKSWIDSFGSRFSKMIAIFYIHITTVLSEQNKYILNIFFFSLIFFIFFIVSYYLIKVYEKNTKNNNIIT